MNTTTGLQNSSQLFKQGGIMPIYKVEIVMEENSMQDAEEHLLSLSGSDLLEHLTEEE